MEKNESKQQVKSSNDFFRVYSMKGGARPGSGRKPTLFDEKRAISLKNQGFSYKAIADRFGIKRDVIRYFFRKMNEKATSAKDQRATQEST